MQWSSPLLLLRTTRVSDSLMTFISGRLRTLDLFQRFCSFRREMKVLSESGQRSIDMLNSSRAIGSLHAS